MSDKEKMSSSEKRLNVNLPPDRFSRAQALAKGRGTTLKELVRYALSLMERIYAESDHGYRIAFVDSNDKVVKELIVPF